MPVKIQNHHTKIKIYVLEGFCVFYVVFFCISLTSEEILGFFKVKTQFKSYQKYKIFEDFRFFKYEWK